MRLRPFALAAWAAVTTAMLQTALVQPTVAQVKPGEQTYRLKHVNATDVASKLRLMLSGLKGPKPDIMVDRRGNRIIAKGPNQKLVSAFIQTLDQPEVRQQPAGRALQQAAPEARGYRVPKGKLDDTLAKMRSRFPQNTGARFAVDRRTGQLLVVATPDVHRQVSNALGQTVNKVAANEDVIRLQHINWRELEASLTNTFGDQLKRTTAPSSVISTFRVLDRSNGDALIQVNRRTGLVTLMGAPQVTAAWRKVVRGLDAPRFSTSVNTQMVRVRRGNPDDIGKAVSTLRRAVELMKGTAPALSTLNLRKAAANPLISAMFQPPAGAGGPAVIGVDDQGLIGDVDINFVPELGVIIIKGKKRDVARVRKMIDDILKIAAQNQPIVDIHGLGHTNSQAVADLVTTLYDEVYAPRQGPVSITSLDKPNAILIIGQKENVAAVKALIYKLDFPVKEDTQMKIFHLMHISSVDAEQQVRNFFSDRPGTSQPGGGGPQGGQQGGNTQTNLRPGLGTRVRIISDYRSNSLIVQASPRDMAEVAHLLKLLDQEKTPASNELRIFKLKNTLAADVQPILQSAITGQSIIGPQTGNPNQPQGNQNQFQNQFQNRQNQVTPRSTKLTIVNVDTEGNKIIDSGILADVAVTAEPNINALLIRAPAKSMPLLEELIRQLDQLPSASAQLKVYEIKNGDATSLAAMLQQLFGLQVTIGQGAFNQTINAFRSFAQAGQAATSSPLIPLRLAVDVRTNSIIASGSPGDLHVIEVVLLRLDLSDVQTRKTEVIKLKNAPAQDVANAITDFLTRQQQINLNAFQFSQISPFEQVDREVIVVPEVVSNSLIVSATPRYYESIRKVIDDLDRRPAMVMVQVIIAEVSLDDGFEFGAEFGLQDSLLFDRGIASAGAAPSPGFSFNNAPTGNNNVSRASLAGQALSTFGLGRVDANRGYGGLVLSAANESVSILIRALHDAGRMQILSRPQIMTLDNQAAFIQVGARVPRITDTTINALGNIQNSTADEEVGLVLRIHPFINQDGLVTMTLDTEKSEVGPASEGIPIAVTAAGPINSPLINTTTAQTTLSARSGQTVVFAGLITKNRSIRSRRIPFLSDIPIAGQLFRFDSEQESRSELLIIMTPHIVKEDKDYDWIKLTESERMSWCLADVVDIHGDVGLSGGRGLWGPAPSPIIYPHMDPTGTGEVVPTPQPAAPTLSNTRSYSVPKDSPRGEKAVTRQVNSSKLRPTRVYYGPAPQLKVNPAQVRPSQVQPNQVQPAPVPPAVNSVSPAGYQRQVQGGRRSRPVFGPQRVNTDPRRYENRGYTQRLRTVPSPQFQQGIQRLPQVR